MPTKTAKQIPYDKGKPVIGNLSDFRNDSFNMQMRMLEKMGPIYKFKIGNLDVIYLAHPDYNRHILQENYKNYKKNVFYDELKIILGKGLVTSEGEFWRKQRKLIQPAFHHKQIEKFAKIMTSASLELAEQWQTKAQKQEPVNINHDMKEITLEIVVKCLFSHDIAGFSEEAHEAVSIVLDWAKSRLESFIKLPHILHTASNREFRKAYTVLEKIIMGLINERRKMTNRPDDLLTSLLELVDEESQTGMTNQQLFDEILTLFMAGHETTAHTLVWTFYLLSMHTGENRKMLQELDENLTGKTVNLNDLMNLPYTLMVLKESMRYIPSVWGIGREAIEDDEIDGYFIPNGSTVGISIYQMHHHPDYWENPEGFDPERFNSDKTDSINRWVYMPFAGGPRVCIGNNFAMMEAQIILGTLSSRFNLELLLEKPIEFDPGVTLRSNYDFKMRVIERF